MQGLRRMTWIGVTEFYDESICALRSLLHDQPMCSCTSKAINQTSVHVDHGNNADATVLTDGDLKRMRNLHLWRVQSALYAFALSHLRATLRRFKLECILD